MRVLGFGFAVQGFRFRVEILVCVLQRRKRDVIKGEGHDALPWCSGRQGGCECMMSGWNDDGDDVDDDDDDDGGDDDDRGHQRFGAARSRGCARCPSFGLFLHTFAVYLLCSSQCL